MNFRSRPAPWQLRPRDEERGHGSPRMPGMQARGTRPEQARPLPGSWGLSSSLLGPSAASSLESDICDTHCNRDRVTGLPLQRASWGLLRGDRCGTKAGCTPRLSSHSPRGTQTRLLTPLGSPGFSDTKREPPARSYGTTSRAPKFTCSPDPRYLRMRPDVDRVFAEVISLTWGHQGWARIQQDRCPYEKGTRGHRHGGRVLGEAKAETRGHVYKGGSAKDAGKAQKLRGDAGKDPPLQLQGEHSPADTSTLDFWLRTGREQIPAA